MATATADPHTRETATDPPDVENPTTSTIHPRRNSNEGDGLRHRPHMVKVPSGPDGPLTEVEISKLDKAQRAWLVEEILGTKDQDVHRLLQKIADRKRRVGLEEPVVEVRFENLRVDAAITVGSRGRPTILNSYLNFFQAHILGPLRLGRSSKQPFTILHPMSGVLKPGRFTLLLGPPAAGKSTLLKALAGRLHFLPGIQMSGRVSYNDRTFNQFVPQRTAGYVYQGDNHIGQLTTRETLDFSIRCQGAGLSVGDLAEMRRREREMGVEADGELDAFMEAWDRQGKRENIAADYALHYLGLDVCADTLVGDQMIRGVSGGQKKRITTGEIIVGPKKVFFMDEISTGLDSSTTYQIVRCLRDMCHIGQSTILCALLQPDPETTGLFDDIMFISDGSMVYHGPREEALDFFESQGFGCPKETGLADFMQEVTSRKDQQQYWRGSEKWQYVPVESLAEAFKASNTGRTLQAAVDTPYKETPRDADPLAKTPFALGAWASFKACMRREVTLTLRNRFVYKFRTFQTAVLALISATLFFRTRLHRTLDDAALYQGFTFFALLVMLFNGLSEMTFTVQRIHTFFKQRADKFYPAWSFVLPTTVLRLVYSLTESLIFSCITYFVVGLVPAPGRFFRYFFLLFLMHTMSVTLFRAIGGIARNLVVANACGSLLLLGVLLMGGFVLAKPTIKPWTVWLFWIDPLAYAQRGILVNEFRDPRWQNQPSTPRGFELYGARTLGDQALLQRGFTTPGWWYWLAVGVLICFTIIFNLLIIWAHTTLGPAGGGGVIMSEETIADREIARRGGGPAEEEGTRTSSRRLSSLDPNSFKSQQTSGRSRRKKGVSSKKLAALKETAAQMESNQNGEGASDAKADGMVSEGEMNHGMVLPFQPLALTFRDLHYYVDMPEGSPAKSVEVPGRKGPQLEILNGINGAFRPKVLTALMGVTGAGKTTLMDCLAGRKTTGLITGEIRVNGHPWEVHTFARVSGYVEQFDVHSPTATVREAVLFSASMRFPAGVNHDTIEAFTDEVMELVELHPLRDVTIGQVGMGLSVEQRKRTSIAVELVANPAIVFMDEPTSGLDARAAAIVMRTVRNIVDTGRTIVCTIHQPSRPLFEAFDELVLLKRGGKLIYSGPIGAHGDDLVSFFSNVDGVQPIREGLNPATWMLEISTPGAENAIGIDFAEHYANSELNRQTLATIEKLEQPKPGSSPLGFDTLYAQSLWRQYQVLFRRFLRVFWRTPSYNATRFTITLGIALAFMAMYWKDGNKRTSQQDVLNVQGALYAVTLFLGIYNSITVQPAIAIERAVFYRERSAYMYAVGPWCIAQGTCEVIYCTIQATLYSCIVYFSVGFTKSPGDFFYFVCVMILTCLYFTFYGTMAVAITPNLMQGAVLSSFFYGIWNLFAGFIIPGPRQPVWWKWYYYCDPISESIYALVASQLGTTETVIYNPVTEENETVKQYLLTQSNYHHELIGYLILILAGWVLLFWGIAVLGFRFLNFQKR
ncbi:hypothetical protein WJX73_004507 [Symbiochloris irregularis]|uniref:ABC transporter domain-containing protein n=1 Tax=Symbiochloris irregularis TaxID=706552 RepID=A0AAW1P2R2_9CHLO